MKKIKFISAIALTLVMASCEDFDLPNPPGQTNPNPDGYFENSGLVLAPGAADVNLIDANKANEDVVVATVTELVNFPTDYDLVIEMEVGSDANFTKTATISTTIDAENAVTVNPDAFNGAIQAAQTKKPGTYDVPCRFVAYAVKGTTRMRLGGLDAFYGMETFKVRTLDPAKVMEDTYYIVGDFCNWDVKKAVKMNNTKGNISVYDNPEFAAKLDVPAGQTLSWKVIPASSFDAGTMDAALGCSPAEGGLSGKLVSAEGTNQAGVIELNGQVLVTINVEVDSYTINYAFEVLYPFTSGNTNKPGDVMLLYTNDYINYTGVAMLNNIWYLAAQPDYKGDIVFKQNKEIAVEDSEDGLGRIGGLTLDADLGDNLRTPAKGKHLYWMDINLVQLTYDITCLETLSVIGSGNGWDLATATPLTPSSDFKVWKASDVEIGDEFKINANGAWAIGFSGVQVPDAMGEYVYTVNKQDGGDNLKCDKPGKYNVTVDFSAKPYTVTLSK